MTRESSNMQIDYPFTNGDGSGIEIQQDGTPPKVLGIDGVEIGRILGAGPVLEQTDVGDSPNGSFLRYHPDGTVEVFKEGVSGGTISGDTEDQTFTNSLQKRVDIGATHKWMFEETETVTDNTGTRQVVKNEFGEEGFTLAGNASLQNSSADVYADFHPEYYTWRRPGDTILMGECLRCDADGDGAVAKGTKGIIHLDREFTIHQVFKPESVRGYLFSIAPMASNERFGVWIEDNISEPTGPLGTCIKLRSFGSWNIVMEGFTDTNIGKVNVLTLVNRRQADGTFKFVYFLNGDIGISDLDSVRSPTPEVEMDLTVGGRYDEEGNLTYSMVGDIGKTVIYDRALSDEECAALYWNPHLGIMTVGVGSSSLKGQTGISNRDNATFYKLDDEYREGNKNIAWNFGTSGKSFYHGAPDNYPVPGFVKEASPVRSGSVSTIDDQYIAKNTSSSHVTLSIPPVMHLEEFKVKIKVQSINPVAGQCVYAEGMDDDTDQLYGVFVDDIDTTKAKLIYKNAVTDLEYITLVDVFDGDSHLIEVYRDVEVSEEAPGDGRSVVIAIDGDIVGRIITEELEDRLPADNATIGALLTDSAVSGNFQGYMWDFVSNDTIIPLNDQDTVIEDSEGAQVGTLVNDTGVWGSWFVSRPRPSSETDKNITQAVLRMGADLVMWWYPSNYTDPNKIYTPYTEGSTHYQEYVDVWRDVVDFCDSKGVPVITITPFPTAGNANNGVVRGDLHKDASDRILSLSKKVVDGFSLSDGTNTAFASEYYYDGVHTNDAGQLELFDHVKVITDVLYQTASQDVSISDSIKTNRIFIEGFTLLETLDGFSVTSADGSGLEIQKDGSVPKLLGDNGVEVCRLITSNSIQGYLVPSSGLTVDRPLSAVVGETYFDTDLGKQIVFNGTDWINVDGTPLV